MNLKPIIKQKDKGVILFLALIVMSIVLAVALGLSSILVSQIRMSSEMRDSIKAFYAADTGVERALFDKANPSDNYNGTLDNGAEYNVTVVCSPSYLSCPPPLVMDGDCSGSYFCYKSIGIYKGIKRAIEIER